MIDDSIADWRETLIFTLLAAVESHPLARRVLAGLEPEVTDRVLEIPALAEFRKATAERIQAGQLAGTVRTDIDPVIVGNGIVSILLSLLMSVVQVGGDVALAYRADVAAVFEAALDVTRRLEPAPRARPEASPPRLTRPRPAHRARFVAILPRCEWPEGFMWGTGASSTQCEGAAPASDWWAWERDGHAPISGDGNGFATRYAEDFARYAELGLTHHRLSIEWARIEPEPGRRDDGAVAHYREVLAAARDAGVSPWVCLHHFTLPAWFADSRRLPRRAQPHRAPGPATSTSWPRRSATWWPGGSRSTRRTTTPGAAYRAGGWPPGHDDRAEAAVADEAIHLANAEAAVRLRQTGAPVASIFGLSAIVAQDDDPGHRPHGRAAARDLLGAGARPVPRRRAAGARAASRSSGPTWPAPST